MSDPVRFTLVIPAALDAVLLEWRRRQPDLPDRNEAIRRLLERALDAATTEGGSSPVTGAERPS